MRSCDLIQRDDFGNVEPPPSRLKCLIDGESGIDLCLNRNIVAANEEESGIDKDEFPHRCLGRGRIGRVRCDGAALRENRRIGPNVRGKCHLDYVMNSSGS